MIAGVLFDGLWQGGAVAAIGYLVTLQHSKAERDDPLRGLVFRAGGAGRRAALASLSSLGALVLTALQPRAASDTWAISLIPAQTMVQVAAELFAPATHWIALAWAMGAGLCLARLGASLVQIERIRRRATILSNERSEVLVSSDVAMPVAVGFLNPAILIPGIARAACAGRSRARHRTRARAPSASRRVR